jgi:hypothetical protein
VDLERHLYGNGTRIIKFFLHLSKEEQRKRFLQRIDEPEKNWKFGLADIEERKFYEMMRVMLYEAHHRPEAQHPKSSAIHKLGRPITPSIGGKADMCRIPPNVRCPL